MLKRCTTELDFNLKPGFRTCELVSEYNKKIWVPEKCSCRSFKKYWPQLGSFSICNISYIMPRL